MLVNAINFEYSSYLFVSWNTLNLKGIFCLGRIYKKRKKNMFILCESSQASICSTETEFISFCLVFSSGVRITLGSHCILVGFDRVIIFSNSELIENLRDEVSNGCHGATLSSKHELIPE